MKLPFGIQLFRWKVNPGFYCGYVPKRLMIDFVKDSNGWFLNITIYSRHWEFTNTKLL